MRTVDAKVIVVLGGGIFTAIGSACVRAKSDQVQGVSRNAQQSRKLGTTTDALVRHTERHDV